MQGIPQEEEAARVQYDGLQQHGAGLWRTQEEDEQGLGLKKQ